MELLFKREQTIGKLSRVNFKLWGKLEVTEDEQALIKLYRFNQAVLIGADDRHLLRSAAKWGAAAFVIVSAFLSYLLSSTGLGMMIGLGAGVGVGYLYMNEKRETIMVQDLLWGRNFTCDSVIELAKKEAWLEGACSMFRQVMESAKNWDGVERHTIDPLPKEQARELILRAY
jgi:hypothetical protein